MASVCIQPLDSKLANKLQTDSRYHYCCGSFVVQRQNWKQPSDTEAFPVSGRERDLYLLALDRPPTSEDFDPSRGHAGEVQLSSLSVQAG